MSESDPKPLYAAPSYREIGVPEVDDNPLTAHLPLAPETKDEAFLALAQRPNFDKCERDRPNSVRRLYIKRLRRFFAPVHPAHVPALNSICTSLHDGYGARNPMTPIGQRFLHGHSVDLANKPEIMMIAGSSGMGKSTLVDRILDYLGGQAWGHTLFKGRALSETQIVWLRRNVPHKCTVGTLCSTFGDYTDKVLGMRLYGGVFARLKGTDSALHLSEISRIIKTHHVGLLVLDEFQNLSLMGVGAKSIIALLVNLRDELGLPIVVVGTYKALRLLKSELSTARRLVEGGYFDLKRPLSAADDHWNHLCLRAWEYQWIRNPMEFTDTVGEALYEVSQGITGIMLTALATAQLAAIDDGSERVDEALIRKVFEEQMEPLHPAVEVLKSRDPRLLDKFDDLYKSAWPSADGEVIEEGPPGDVLNAEANAIVAPEAGEPPVDARAVNRRQAASAARRADKRSPALSAEEIRELVMAHSAKDLAGLLDGR
jgi:hypothetical protein